MGDAAGAVAGQAAQNGADHGAIGPDAEAAATAAPQADSARMFTSRYGAGSAGTAGTAASRAKLTTGEVDSSCGRAVAGAGSSSHGAAAVRPASRRRQQWWCGNIISSSRRANHSPGRG